MPSMERLCHRHLAEIKIADGQLMFTLHSQVTLSIPYNELSVEHRMSKAGTGARIYFTLSDDWQKITCSQLGVTLDVNDILEHWIYSSKSGPQRHYAAMDAHVLGKKTS